MKVIVSDDVVRRLIGTPESRKLHQLIGYGIEEQHVILFSSQLAINEWIAKQDPALHTVYRHAIQLGVRTAATLSADTATVVITHDGIDTYADPVAHLGLDSAIELLNEPLGVFVENGNNDWDFLRGIMRPSERERIRKAESKGWITALHGGGANLKSLLASRCQNKSLQLRTFAMFDSDRRHPDELIDAWMPIPPEACEGYSIELVAKRVIPGRFWMLSRRFIESYMPENEIRAAVSTNTAPMAPDAYFRLSQPGRWYFNMKKGFAGDAFVENAHRCRDLYASVSPEDRVALANGFGRKLADQYALLKEREFDWDDLALTEAGMAIPKLLRLL